MILADTSVWIDYLNGKVTPQTDLLDKSLIEGTIAMGDLILLEILQGIRKDKEFEQVKAKLSLLDQYSMFNPSSVVQYANNYRALRKLGVTVRRLTMLSLPHFVFRRKCPFYPIETLLLLPNTSVLFLPI